MKTVIHVESPGCQPGGLSFSKRNLLFLALLLAIFEIAFYTYKFSLSGSGLVDTDCYMRLVRVQELYDSGKWYDSIIDRSNAPYGETLHWTRPLDLLLMLGAYIGAPILGFSKALFWWGVAISPVLQLISIIALAWAAVPLFNQDGLMRLCLLLLGQAGVWEAFAVGRPDHHSLLALFFIILLGCSLRMLYSQRMVYCLAGGIIAALGMWVSVEFLAAVGMVTLIITVLWLTEGFNWAQKGFAFYLAMAAAAALAMVIERPPAELFVIEYDKISIVHLVIFSIFIIFWTVVVWADLVAGRKRFWAIMTGVVVGLAVVELLFPAFFKGPFATINPGIVPVWLSKVNEVQPLFSTTRVGIANTIMLLGPSLLVVPYTIWNLIIVKGRNKSKWVLFAAGMVIFVPLTLYQVRWSSYAGVIMVLPLGLLLSSVVNKGAASHPVIASISRIALTAIFCLTFLLAGTLIFPKNEQPTNISITKAAAFLSDRGGLGGTSKTILTNIDFGPEILYRTSHKVIATPYHRNGDGIMMVYDVMTAATDAEALRLLESRKVDLIIICPESNEGVFYSKSNTDDSFYKRLITGQYPAWLKPVAVPQELNGFWIYEVAARSGG